MRLIDADELLTSKNIVSQYSEYGVADLVPVELIQDAPTIDAEPVVHCRNCKYWQDNNGGYPHEECRWGKEETPDGDDFCSYGERREE